MGSMKVIILLGFLAVVLISSEVFAAKDLVDKTKETKENNGVEDAKYGGGGYNHGGGGYNNGGGGYNNGGGGYNHGGGGGGYCRHGCCYRGNYRCQRCCMYAGEASVDAAKP